jgi:hypothetical protein
MDERERGGEKGRPKRRRHCIDSMPRQIDGEGEEEVAGLDCQLGLGVGPTHMLIVILFVSIIPLFPLGSKRTCLFKYFHVAYSTRQVHVCLLAVLW